MESIQLDPQGFVEILTDRKTSLLQKDYFLMRLEEEFKKSWRYGWTYTLIVFEAPGLGALRASEGDLAADSLELDIAGEILSASRDIDLSTRCEDGRFMVMLPGCDSEGAMAFGKRVLQGSLPERLQGRSSLLAGGTVTPQAGLDQMDELLARAETALTHARSLATDQLVLWNDPSE